jgi:hypothetical protein
MFDLDTLTVPDNPFDEGREIFDAVHAWDSAPQRVFISTVRAGPRAVLQLGYDITTARIWLRSLAESGLAWSAWMVPGSVDPHTAPALLSAIMVNGNKSVLIHFDLMLDVASVPPLTAFTVTRDGASRVVTGIRISGTDVEIDLSTQTGSGTILCSYIPPASNKLRSTDGIDVKAFSDFPVSV